MSTEKQERVRTGPKIGSGDRKKICVSVSERNWQAALSKWRELKRQNKPSWLVDLMIVRYLEREAA